MLLGKAFDFIKKYNALYHLQIIHRLFLLLHQPERIRKNGAGNEEAVVVLKLLVGIIRQFDRCGTKRNDRPKND